MTRKAPVTMRPGGGGGGGGARTGGSLAELQRAALKLDREKRKVAQRLAKLGALEEARARGAWRPTSGRCWNRATAST